MIEIVEVQHFLNRFDKKRRENEFNRCKKPTYRNFILCTGVHAYGTVTRIK